MAFAAAIPEVIGAIGAGAEAIGGALGLGAESTAAAGAEAGGSRLADTVARQGAQHFASRQFGGGEQRQENTEALPSLNLPSEVGAQQ